MTGTSNIFVKSSNLKLFSNFKILQTEMKTLSTGILDSMERASPSQGKRHKAQAMKGTSNISPQKLKLSRLGKKNDGNNSLGQHGDSVTLTRKVTESSNHERSLKQF